MQSVRNTRVPVLIQYTGKPDAIGLKAPGLPDTVMIEVRDAGARLNTYHRDPLHLTIDLHSYIHGEKGRIYIPSDALRRSISDILQGTSRLIETQPEDITCDFFTEQEKSVLLVFRGDLKTANEYQIIGQPTLSSQTNEDLRRRENPLRHRHALHGATRPQRSQRHHACALRSRGATRHPRRGRQR